MRAAISRAGHGNGISDGGMPVCVVMCIQCLSLCHAENSLHVFANWGDDVVSRDRHVAYTWHRLGVCESCEVVVASSLL